MELWQWILSLSLAAVAAALVPALLQARRTLRSIEELAAGTRPRLERALDEMTAATARVNQVAATIERQAEVIRPLAEGIADLGASLRRTRYFAGALSAIGAALGPALASAMGVLFNRGETPKSGVDAVEEPDAADTVASEPVPLRRAAGSGGEA